MMRTMLGCLFGISSVVLSSAAAPQTPATPTNNLPNPYQTVENYFKLPEGRTWGSTSAVAVDKDGKSIWVGERCGANSCAGSKLPSILHFAADGSLIKAFGEGLLLSPHGIYVDRDGNIWAIDCACTGGGGGRRAAAPSDPSQMTRQIIDPGNPGGSPPLPSGHQIFKFSPDGTVLMRLGTAGGAREPDFFWQPNAMVIAADGSIFVSEGHSSAAGSTARVMKFSKDGKLIRSFGKLGTGPGEFDQPHAAGLRLERPALRRRSQQQSHSDLRSGFQLLDTWTQFSRPSGIAIDKNDVIYVADSESESISRGNNMHGHEGWKRGIRIGSAKDGSVKYFIPDPVAETTGTSAAEGIAVDPAGNIYGAEVGPRR